MYTLSNSLIEQITSDPEINAATYHRSAKSDLSEPIYSNDVLETWATFGKIVVSLAAARQTLNSPDCRTPGKASHAVIAVSQYWMSSLTSAISNADLIKVGQGVRQDEKNSFNTLSLIAYQLIGALAFKEGFASAANKFLFPIPLKEGTELRIGKDARTILQEFMQSRRKPLPNYEITAVQGKNHNQTFTAKVTAAGRTAEGTGPKKRSAEQHAANEYLRKFLPDLVSNSPLEFSSPINIPHLTMQIPKQRNNVAAKETAKSLGLEEWAGNLISLAFTHPSFSAGENRLPFGKDNKLLAFMGSYVVQWAIMDSVMKSMPPFAIKNAGGLPLLFKYIFSEQAAIEALHRLDVSSLLCVGPGESDLSPTSQVEFVQAYCGAIFLSNNPDKLTHAQDIFHLCPAIGPLVSGGIAERSISRNEVKDPKNLLLEACQEIGIEPTYHTSIFYKNAECKITPILEFNSPWLPQKLRIVGNSEQSLKNKSRRKGEVESELAADLVTVVDFVAGRLMRPDEQRHNKYTYVYKWLLQHSLKLIAAHIKSGRRPSKGRKSESLLLGVGFIKAGNFDAFCEWHTASTKLLGTTSLSEASFLINFYSWAGQQSNSTKNGITLVKNLSALEAKINSLDPLNVTEDIRTTDLFKTLVQEATIYKLLGNSIQKVSLEKILSDASLIFRERAEKICLISKHNPDLLEVDGAHIALIGLFLSENEIHECISFININTIGSTIEIEVTKKLASAIQIFQTLNRSPLWRALSELLPIVGTKENETSFVLRIPSISARQTNDSVLQYWLSYKLQGRLGTATSDTIAAILHDLKNDILGYASSSGNARAKATLRERYSLAAQATGHIEQALSAIRTVKSLLESTEKRPVEEISIEDFMRSMISSLWSWLPSNIQLDAPISFPQELVWTNASSLRSIITNLAKNAAEAMPTGGKLKFTCRFLDDGVEFKIQDNGPGFSPDKLSLINEGIPILSSKNSGQGIGLLTVLLLTKDLNGSVSFDNIDPTGVIVTIWVPSYSPEESDN